MLKVRTKREKHRIDLHGAIWWVIPLTPTELKDMMQQHRKVEWDSPTRVGRKERFIDYDFLNITFDRIDKIIVGWEDVVDEEGNPLPCDREHKLLVYEYNPGVINDVIEAADRITIEADKHEKEAEKN